MEILEALSKERYPQDKVITSRDTNKLNIAFNEGWNELRKQLVKIVAMVRLNADE